jgi:hypothetical protein
MIFRLGSLPEVPEFTPDNNWITLEEPSAWSLQLRAIPIGIITTIVFIFLWLVLTPVGQFLGTMTFPPPILRNALSIVGVIVVHEIIHAVAHPKFGVSKDTVIGFWPSRVFLYTIYIGEQSKNRCVAILIMPFIIISVVPLIFATITQIAPLWLGYVSTFNALLACVDMVAAFMTIRQIPRGSIIRTKGWTTFFRRTG